MTAEPKAEETRAEQSVSVRFTRLMKASTSPYGILTDPPIVAIATAVMLMGMLSARQVGARALVVHALEALTLFPIACAAMVTLALSVARAKVVRWLARLPFPVENMNAVLNGLGDTLVIRFSGEPPPTEALNAELDRFNQDCFVTE